MIAKSLKHAVNVRKGSTICFNTFKGTDIVHYYIPDSYVELQYISSPSNKQCYIDTGIIPEDNTIIKVKFSCTTWTAKTSAIGSICGTVDGHVSLSWTNDSISSNWNLTKKDGTQTGTFTVSGNTATSFIINSNYNISGDLYTTEYSDWIQHMNYQLWNSKGICTLNLIPVRRLGDGICGMFDTINQKFHPSKTQYPFEGGDIKLISNISINVNDADNTLTTNKSETDNILYKTFISNATYSNTQNTYYICKYDDNSIIKWSSTSVIQPYHVNAENKGDFSRIYMNCRFTIPTYNMVNVNPNWLLIKGALVSGINVYVAYNQNLYYTNKSQIQVVPVGSRISGGDVMNIPISNISKIVHLPYLQYSSIETKYIDIGPVDSVDKYTIDTAVSNIQDNSAPVFGMISNNRDVGVSAILSNSGSEVIINNHSLHIPLDNDSAHTIRCTTKECIYNQHRYNSSYTNTAGITSLQSLPIGHVEVVTDINSVSTSATDSKMSSNSRIHYIRIETTNQLYKHLLPALMILNNYEFTDSNGVNHNYILGYFEVVNQVFYQCDASTYPAFTGDSLSADYSNVVDINGNNLTDFVAT